jgi:hypothetical protein
MTRSKLPTAVCLNCNESKACALIEMSIPVAGREEHELAERLFLCPECLEADIGTLGAYLAGFFNLKPARGSL